jgi:hypothetical protein
MSNLTAKDFTDYIRNQNPNLDEMLDRTRKENVYLRINSFYGFITVETRSKYKKL